MHSATPDRPEFGANGRQARARTRARKGCATQRIMG